MDRDELRYHTAARRQGLTLWRNEDGTWSLGPAPSTAPLEPGRVRAAETFISAERIRLADGRVFPLRMTTGQLVAALGIEE